MLRIATATLATAMLIGICAMQYLTWQEVKSVRKAALYAATKAEDATASAMEASDRAGVACRASLEAIGKLPKGGDIWTTPTIESSQRSAFCGGADLDNL